MYAFNGFQWLWRQLLLSMTSLRRFVKDNITVFYAPPRFKEHTEWLKSRCDLRLVEAPLNSPEFRAKRVYFRNRYWGHNMKLHAYTVQTSIMVNLDCDTVVHGNILEVLEEDYDLLVAEWLYPSSKTLMTANCKKLGLPTWPLMMDGFVVFKNYAHLKFRPIYEKYLRMVALGEVSPHDSVHLGVHAFNLAINHFRREGFKVVRMPRDFHVFTREYAGAKYVTHIPDMNYATWEEKKLFSEELHKLKMVGDLDGEVA